uniref:Uncharacterized protein n=1 Tax=Ditylenchus dipsaci TaxID=166011 RepID=A0A915EPV3_9BILA
MEAEEPFRNWLYIDRKYQCWNSTSNISVEFDPFYTRDLNLIDSDANTKFYGETATKKNIIQRFIYICQKDGNFTYEGSGHKGSDIVKISELSTRMTFGVLDKVGYRYQKCLFVLSPSFNNLSDAAIQLVGQLDQPVISVWINSTPSGNGSLNSRLAEDTDHASLLQATFHSSRCYSYSFSFNGAVHNKSYGRYDVDCEAKKAGQVTLNIGGEGNTTSSSNKQIVLTGADYIRYIAKVDGDNSASCKLETFTKPDLISGNEEDEMLSDK